LYKLGCYSSLALVNREGKAGGACVDGAYTGGAYINGACADGAYIDGACRDGACIGGAYIGGAYTNRAYADGACVDGACDIVYSKSPISLGNSRFIYIKGPIKILLSL
jgi:uncharacterized protein YjbI with pentapeptide repeats